MIGLALLGPLPVMALTLDLPGPAVLTLEQAEALGSYDLPIGPWRDGLLPVQPTEGAIRQSAYRIATPDQTTLQILAPLRDQLLRAGYRVLFECEAADCGGFDFRYGTKVLAEPEMHVDMGDFRFLSADNGADYVSLLVSRSRESGFVQITQISAAPGPDQAAGPPAAGSLPGTLPNAAAADLLFPDLPAPETPPLSTGDASGTQSGTAPDPAAAPDLQPPPGALIALLEQAGAAPLDDLSFLSGSAELAAGDYASLIELAAYLANNPGRRVVLVGHTDASGALDANIALSRRRAASVVARLLSLGAVRAQLAAQGVGYLAPRASNLTEAGRTQNRRVEVVITSTQ